MEGLAVLAAFLLGAGIWLLLIQRIRYEWMWTAYWAGAAIPIGGALAMLALLRA